MPPLRQPPLPTEEARAKLIEQAEATMKAGTDEDYERLADLTHPAVQASGGREKFIRNARQAVAETKAAGWTVSGAVGEPTDVKEAGGALYVVVSAPLMLKKANGTTFGQSAYLLGVSENGGQSWGFVNVASEGITREALKTLFPGLPDALELPKWQIPVLLREGDDEPLTRPKGTRK